MRLNFDSPTTSFARDAFETEHLSSTLNTDSVGCKIPLGRELLVVSFTD